MVKIRQRPGHCKIDYFAVPEGSAGRLSRFHREFEQKIPNFYNGAENVPKPLSRVLIVPALKETHYSVSREMAKLREARNNGWIEYVMFDSGGYQAMTGSIDFDHLYGLNYGIYNRYHDIADILVALDYPAVGSDSTVEYERKVTKTIDATVRFFDDLKPEAQSKYCPVFHPREKWDIDRFWREYEPIIQHTKFASYSAAAVTVGVRLLTPHVASLIEEIQVRMREIGAHLHCLGIASTKAVQEMIRLGIRTYDSSSHIKSGAYGSLIWPDRPAEVFSSWKPEESISVEKLREIQEVSGHRCPYCTDIDGIWTSGSNRQKHNLIVMDELSHFHYNNGSVTWEEKDRNDQLGLF